MDTSASRRADRICDIVDGEGAFRRTMASPLPAGALDAPWPAFSFLTPRDLVPDAPRGRARRALASPLPAPLPPVVV